MVGIGGGVPSRENAIRLGDVVRAGSGQVDQQDNRLHDECRQDTNGHVGSRWRHMQSILWYPKHSLRLDRLCEPLIEMMGCTRWRRSRKI